LIEIVGKSQPILQYPIMIWTKINKGKPTKAKVMILSISIYLVNSLSHVPLSGNGAKNACWYFLASLITKLSSLAWC
jgi:hypothetical protein